MTRPSSGSCPAAAWSYSPGMRAFFSMKSGSRLPFQVLVACQLIPASRSTPRTVSVLTTIRCASVRCSTSLVRLHVVNGHPSCCGAVLATRQIVSRAAGPNLRGRPPLHFGSKAANPRSLNAWITSRAYCAVAANMPAASTALRPCTEASTIPARRSRTRSRAVLVILTRRCISAGSNSRTNTSGCRAAGGEQAVDVDLPARWWHTGSHRRRAQRAHNREWDDYEASSRSLCRLFRHTTPYRVARRVLPTPLFCSLSAAGPLSGSPQTGVPDRMHWWGNAHEDVLSRAGRYPSACPAMFG
jgi:hypothetical protein